MSLKLLEKLYRCSVWVMIERVAGVELERAYMEHTTLVETVSLIQEAGAAGLMSLE